MGAERLREVGAGDEGIPSELAFPFFSHTRALCHAAGGKVDLRLWLLVTPRAGKFQPGDPGEPFGLSACEPIENSPRRRSREVRPNRSRTFRRVRHYRIASLARADETSARLISVLKQRGAIPGLKARIILS
jgi:hypothetical protein